MILSCERMQPLLSIELSGEIHRFGDTVGVQQQGIPRGDRAARIFVCGVFEDAEDTPVAGSEAAYAGGSASQERRVVAAVTERDAAPVQVEDAVEQTDEHLRGVLRVEQSVDLLKTRGRRDAAERRGLQQGTADGHEDGRRYPLPGDVADDHGEMRRVDQEKVVEVPADVLRREHRGVEIEVQALRKRGKTAR